MHTTTSWHVYIRFRKDKKVICLRKRCSTWFIWYQSPGIPATLLETSYSLWLSLKAISRKTKCVSRNMLRGPLNCTFFRLDYRPKIYFVDQNLANNCAQNIDSFWSSLSLWWYIYWWNWSKYHVSNYYIFFEHVL